MSIQAHGACQQHTTKAPFKNYFREIRVTNAMASGFEYRPEAMKK